MTSLGDICADDQRTAERREARRLATSLAGDVVAYHAALKDAGIADPLLTTLVTQFNAAWIGQTADEVDIDFSLLLGGDE